MTTSQQPAYSGEFQARVVGPVQHRIGDGQLEEIPRDLDVQVSTAIASYVLSWEEDGQPVTVSLSTPDFDYHVEQGNILVK
ncbi:hypothetical protein GCM10027082_32650 [Comamonas humi]